MIKITGTFIDEISHDIPHQNWGVQEWTNDFKHMKAIGIKRVFLIRCGYRQWVTFPSEVLLKEQKVIQPLTDLVSLFLQLAEENDMEFYFGLYDSGKYWVTGNMNDEIELNKKVIDEVWYRYGSRKAFKGWYLSQESSGNTESIVQLYHELGSYCKKVSGNLPVMISPYIDGVKNISQYDQEISKTRGISIDEHYRYWDRILKGTQKSVDIIAFQDGHVAYDQLEDFTRINKELADTYGFISWINTETFDRDMPIKFLPIKWDKLRFKLGVAENCGISEAITFEFSHFMSPQSCYLQARNLYNRYSEYL